MNQEEIKSVEERLIAERAAIEKDMAHLKETLDFGHDIDHGEEESDESEEMGNYLSVKRSQDARLERIKRSLEKIKSGTYGTCENCGASIDKEVLAIDPESLLCRACKLKAVGRST